MRKKIIVLFDSDIEYARLLSDYLRTRKELPFELHTVTSAQHLEALSPEKEILLLMAAEKDMKEAVRKVKKDRLLILNESGKVENEEIRSVGKYQRAETIYKAVMEHCMADMDGEGGLLLGNGNTKLIGLYSPVRRCLQTSFALTLGQILAEKYRTLYLSFEQYAGWSRETVPVRKPNLTDLLYFSEESGERFYYRLRSIEDKAGELCVIPPAWPGHNLIYVPGKQWEELIRKIVRQGGYEYVVLDIGESIQGVFEILRQCNHIYTILKEDRLAMAKVAQYEQLLLLNEMEDVLHKTSKETLPYFTNLPEQVEQYGKGELGEYIKKLIARDMETA